MPAAYMTEATAYLTMSTAYMAMPIAFMTMSTAYLTMWGMVAHWQVRRLSSESRWFESHFSRNVHVGTLSIGQVLHLKLSGPQRACLAVKYDSCNNLLSFVHNFYL